MAVRGSEDGQHRVWFVRVGADKDRVMHRGVLPGRPRLDAGGNEPVVEGLVQVQLRDLRYVTTEVDAVGAVKPGQVGVRALEVVVGEGGGVQGDRGTFPRVSALFRS